MDLFSHSLDITRLVFLIGALFAMLYKRSTGVTPGGIIVPAFLAIIIDQSFIWFVSILFLAAITRLVYTLLLGSHALSRHWVVFYNICIAAGLSIAFKYLLIPGDISTELLVFGFSLPGLLSANSLHYGFRKVFFGTLLVTAITVTIGYVMTLLIPYSIATNFSTELGAFNILQLGLSYTFLPLSLIAAGIISYFYGVRTGGYVLAPSLGLLAVNSTLQFVTFILATALGYLIVRKVLQYSLITGLERFVLCLLVSALLVSLTDLIATQINYSAYLSSAMVLMISMGVIINDLSLQTKKLKATLGVTSPVIIATFCRMLVKI